VKRFTLAIQIWLLSLAVWGVAVVLSFYYLDIAIALYCSRLSQHLSPLQEGLGSAVILSGEAVTVMALVLARMVRGSLPPYAEALAMACLTSICAYAINDGVLKLIFGVPNLADVMSGSRHAFHFWRGSPHSNFPSGHMVLAGAFAGVFIRLYKTSILPLAILVLLAAALLVAGGWHFLSDVIAGAFLGLSAGLLAGELWQSHRMRLRGVC
jgi:membrane-associated phospholipid phosphatase